MNTQMYKMDLNDRRCMHAMAYIASHATEFRILIEKPYSQTKLLFEFQIYYIIY